MGEPEFDVAEQFALQLPLNVISELLNIPHSMRDEIHELADQTLARSDDPSLAEKQMLAQIRIFEIFHGLVAERENNPRDDIISVIMNTEVDDDDEGTHHPQARRRRGRHPVPGDRLRRPRDRRQGHPQRHASPSPRFPTSAGCSRPTFRCSGQTADEVLRYDAPSQLQGRLALEDITLHGVTIPAGSRVMLATAAALRDPRAYPDPDRFDITAPERSVDDLLRFRRPSLHRRPPGAAGDAVAFEELVTRFPNFAVDESRAVRHVSSNVRGVAHLPLLTNGAG